MGSLSPRGPCGTHFSYCPLAPVPRHSARVMPLIYTNIGTGTRVSCQQWVAAPGSRSALCL